MEQGLWSPGICDVCGDYKLTTEVATFQNPEFEKPPDG